MADTIFDRINDYRAVKISLASPNDIRSWSFGEVKKPETINYRTYRPEKDGLFCERIFGPERDYECACGKYRGTKHKGVICDRCGVKVTHSRVRRKRMGHLNLAAPVVHIWFFKAMPNRLGNLLEMKSAELEKVIYFQDYVVIDRGDTPLKPQQVLSEEEYRQARDNYGQDFEAGMGAEAIRELLTGMDFELLAGDLRAKLAATSSRQKIKDLSKRLKIVEAIKNSPNKAEWLIHEVIPVIPPGLRPLVLLESGNFATSDLNDLYRRIINRNNRLKKLMDLNAPEVIIRNEKRMLQQAVDSLFDNGRCRRPVLGSSNRPLKSLTDMIKGKQGRFRENLLGKRVDYSARSVIVVGPELKLHQCGLPKKIALELFQPFIIRKLKDRGLADTIKSAKKMIERRDQEIWDILEEVIHQHPVLLNRAPTLHRMGIQAFEPILVEGNAIKIHPLVCKGFNADFDGDQMAVHLPLSVEAQAEAHCLMLSVHNIFSPSNGQPIVSPSQDIVLGIYFLTVERSEDSGAGRSFRDPFEAIRACSDGVIGMHAPIKVRLPEDKQVLEADRKPLDRKRGYIQTTAGRCLFNDILHPDMPFYNFTISQKGVSSVISDCHEELGKAATLDLLDDVKEAGFRYSTLAGVSIGVNDLKIPRDKQKLIAQAQKEVERVQQSYDRGSLTELERYNQVIDVWIHAREAVGNAMMEDLKNDTREGKPYLNPVFIMADSGARGSKDQIRQLAGMRGLISRPSGEIVESPIRSNFREGLSVLEYFSSTHGARKGLADTALKTADSGYLTRKLADVAQNVIVCEEDCGTLGGIIKSTIYKGEQVDVPLREMIIGRIARENIINPITDETIVKENDIINDQTADKIEDLGIETIRVRSPLTCESAKGVCAKCYGVDLSSGNLVEDGLAVGIVAAQSIGEPGTQLTMRTFHIGGVASRAVIESDIRATQPGRIKWEDDNLNPVTVTDTEGKPSLVTLKRKGEIAIHDDKGRELDSYRVPYGATILVRNGQKVAKGERVVTWDPHRMPILAEKGGVVRFQDIVEGETVRTEDQDSRREGRMVVIEHRGEVHPCLVIEDAEGKVLDFHYLPAKAHIEVSEGQEVSPGSLMAMQSREISGTEDITGGLPRVTELFEARKPKNPAVMAEISGTVELRSDKRRGKMTIIIRSKSTEGEKVMEKEHHVPHDKHLHVHTGDYVEAGDPLIDGPLVPHDILRIRGEEALHTYLLTEVQNVYRSQNVTINDKHIETILSQMLRKVMVESAGDTEFLPSEVVDKYRWRQANQRMAKSLKITDPGDTTLETGQVALKTEINEANATAGATGGHPAKGKRCHASTAKTLLLGITKASLQSESFISSASFQETTKVLTEASLAGKRDYLQGLKENVVLGHLIPAGTSFRPYMNIKPKHVGVSPAEELLKADLTEFTRERKSIPSEVVDALPD